MGADGWLLLDALEAPATPDWMKTLPAVTTLRTIWEQQFEPREQGGRWRPEPALPAAQLIDAGYVTIAHLVQSQSSYGVDAE